MLEGFTLTGCATMRNINFAKADLANSIFNGSDLSKTDFVDAVVRRAIVGARLIGANFYSATFNDSTQQQASAANLQNADLSGANLALAGSRQARICRA